jgi:hypothetical protein
MDQHPTHVFYNGRAVNQDDPQDQRTAGLIYTPDDNVLVNADTLAVFDLAGSDSCRVETTWIRSTPEDPWNECTESQLGLRGVRLWSPNRGLLTVTNHTEGGQTYPIPWERHKGEPGHAHANYAHLLPGCQGTDCLSTLYTAGYMFVVPDGHEISLEFETRLGPDDLLSDVLAFEYGEEQMNPATSITIRSVSGSGLETLDGQDLGCNISSRHPRRFITPYGALNAGAGALYTECDAAWPIERPIEDLIDFIRNRGAGPADHDPPVDPNPVDDAPRTEPDAYAPAVDGNLIPEENVLGLYGSAYPDAYADDIDWLHQRNHPSTSVTVDYVLRGVEGGPPEDRLLRIVQRPAFDWFALFDFPMGTPTPLNLTGYDQFHFDVWTANVTRFTVRFRDYGANRIRDDGPAGPDTDAERALSFGVDEGVVPGQWSSITLDLNRMFIDGDSRNVGQLVYLVNERAPAYLNTYVFLANLRFTRSD